MNGLATDLQMFALKSLQIPLPGRHPPSPGYHTPRQTSSDTFDSIRSLKLSSSSQHNISPSIKALRGYYGLSPNGQNGIETTPLGLHRKSKSIANEFLVNEKGVVSDKSAEKLVRRRKSDVDLVKQDAAATSGELPGKGPKATSRTTTEGEPNLISLETFTGVRKSLSAPSFQNSDNNPNWATSVLNLKADLQALSTAAIKRPIFDGLPKPITGRKNKTALD